MINRILRARNIRQITKTTLMVMWLLAFISVGRYEFGCVTFKECMQSICVCMFWWLINGVILICND